MNEIKQTFDYSVVDTNTASFLKLKEQEMQSIVLNSSVQLGEKLIEAQEKLAKYNTGTFEKWFVSLGLKKQTVYNYINQAKFVHQMDESKQIEMFQELPTTLKTEISKPSAKQEAVEMVLSGDIKTTKEYRELEKQLKAKDEQLSLQAQMIDNLQEQEPEVIEKEVVVEKIPSDYERLKRTATEAKELNEKLDKALKDAEYYKKELSATISLNKQENGDAEQAKLKRLQRESDVSVYQLIININNFVKEQAVTIYDSQAIHNSSEEARKKLTESVERAEKMLREVKKEIGGEVAWIINN